jgi:putative ATP-dependent endonuclease of the OLD family
VDCLERFLEITIPDRDDKKPIEIMKAVTSGQIKAVKLGELQTEFCKALGIPLG